ncbi:hypothetical protein RND71_018339 [Anisodus tanguticus]|uniref:Uncharacterized protein n=1 Tax=Anisodus tanguticus TaxID=243964 RepID=A0AAE1VAW0_9SOLA|nr:hypothetical protein RND71_018339 [Anisodus tanguticus]
MRICPCSRDAFSKSLKLCAICLDFHSKCVIPSTFLVSIIVPKTSPQPHFDTENATPSSSPQMTQMKVVMKVLTMSDEKTKQKAIEAAADILGGISHPRSPHTPVRQVYEGGRLR